MGLQHDEGQVLFWCMADVVSAREFKKEGEEYEMHKKSSSIPENPRTHRRVDWGTDGE